MIWKTMRLGQQIARSQSALELTKNTVLTQKETHLQLAAVPGKVVALVAAQLVSMMVI